MTNSKEELDLENDFNFLMICNDYIVSILETADNLKWSSETIEFKEKDKKKVGTKKYDLFYFREHGYATKINKSLYKHLLFSLISDYNIYMSDAIECARKYHFGTAFTLLRKPLKDDLLFIEMLFVKKYRFISKFLKQPIKNFAIENISEKEKIKIINKCCKRINFSTAESMYNLRYSKKSKESLEKIWNKTLHIITSQKNYATEDGNLNIIFANRDIIKENITYFYKVCINVQLYFINLILNILKEENLISQDEFLLNIYQIYFAYSCTLNEEIPQDVLNEFILQCDNCGSIINITQELLNINHKNKTFKYKCKACNKEINIDKFKFNI